MTITKYRPTKNFRGVPMTFSELFDNFFTHDTDEKVSNESFFRPGVDVIESEKDFEIRVAIPGIKKNQINLDINDNELMISGERKSRKETEGSRYHIGEIRYGKFSRSFRLPDHVDRDNIKASFEDGILTVTVPKSVKAQAQKIEIK